LLEREHEFVFNHVKREAVHPLGLQSRSKIINLTIEKDTLSVNGAGIKTQLMDSVSEFVSLDDLLGMLFPPAWGFRMSLES